MDDADPNVALSRANGEPPPPLLSDGWISEQLLKQIYNVGWATNRQLGMSADQYDFYFLRDAKPPEMIVQWILGGAYTDGVLAEGYTSDWAINYKGSLYFNIAVLQTAGVLPAET